VLADEDDRVLEERAAQLAAVEKQLPFQECILRRHIAKSISSLPCSQSGLNLPYVKTLSALGPGRPARGSGWVQHLLRQP
jgi:hypothetical protein